MKVDAIMAGVQNTNEPIKSVREKIYEDKAIDRLKWIIMALEDDWRTQYPEPKKEVQWYSIVLFSKV